jgi:hypothetical protein
MCKNYKTPKEQKISFATCISFWCSFRQIFSCPCRHRRVNFLHFFLRFFDLRFDFLLIRSLLYTIAKRSAAPLLARISLLLFILVFHANKTKIQPKQKSQTKPSAVCLAQAPVFPVPSLVTTNLGCRTLFSCQLMIAPLHDGSGTDREKLVLTQLPCESYNPVFFMCFHQKQQQFHLLSFQYLVFFQ